jgi:hypothetical protein
MAPLKDDTASTAALAGKRKNTFLFVPETKKNAKRYECSKLNVTTIPLCSLIPHLSPAHTSDFSQPPARKPAEGREQDARSRTETKA